MMNAPPALRRSRVTRMPAWIWIPIVLAAAGAQTVRNAAQRSLIKSAGTLPATFVRFVYGLPFAVIGLAAVSVISPVGAPTPTAVFVAWVALGAMAQLVATAFLLAAMAQRSFIVAVAYSKTELLQIVFYSIVLLGEPASPAALFAVILATVGVLLLSIEPAAARRGGASARWWSPAAALGLACGASFALSAVGYRGAALALPDQPPWVAGPYALVFAQLMQSAVLGAWLAARDRPGLRQVMIEWRVSTLAGFMGALASTGWLVAFAMRNAADVRTVGLAEVIYGYAVSRRFFKEAVSGRELAGIVLIALGILVVSST
jgi:drug/metabolite transporter (DMT)-like permease